MFVLYDLDNECYMPVNPSNCPDCCWEEVEPGIKTDYGYCIKGGNVQIMEG